MLNRLIKYKKLKEKEENYNDVNYGDPQLFEKCVVSKIKISYERIHDYLIDDDFKCYDRLNEVMEIDLANTTIKMLQSDKGADHVNSSNEYIFTLENGYKKSRESEYFWTFNIFKKLIVYILHFGEKNIFGKCAGNPEDIFGMCLGDLEDILNDSDRVETYTIEIEYNDGKPMHKFSGSFDLIGLPVFYEEFMDLIVENEYMMKEFDHRKFNIFDKVRYKKIRLCKSDYAVCRLVDSEGKYHVFLSKDLRIYEGSHFYIPVDGQEEKVYAEVVDVEYFDFFPLMYGDIKYL